MHKVIFDDSEKAKQFQQKKRDEHDRGKFIDINDNFGEVPEYILKRKYAKARLDSEENRRRMMNDLVPPGMRLVPEQERLDTLKDLKEARE